MTKAVLDSCVLYSAPLRGCLLNLASVKLFEPFWSEEIQDEWTRSALKNRPKLKRESLERTRQRMVFWFPNACVRGYESIVPALSLPDSNDRHVLAVAIQTQSLCIVTFNLRDFPQSILLPFGIEALSPDEFVFRLIHEKPMRVLQAVKNHRASLTRPSKTVDEYLVTLEKQGLPKTVAFLREHEEDI
jgi:predicted nucleic acid-binding protein